MFTAVKMVEFVFEVGGFMHGLHHFLDASCVVMIVDLGNKFRVISHVNTLCKTILNFLCFSNAMCYLKSGNKFKMEIIFMRH